VDEIYQDEAHNIRVVPPHAKNSYEDCKQHKFHERTYSANDEILSYAVASRGGKLWLDFPHRRMPQQPCASEMVHLQRQFGLHPVCIPVPQPGIR
jgi:hypothetical protein